MQGRTDTQALITPYNSQVSLPHSSPFTSSAFFDMAITHDDLSLRRHKFSNINSKLAHSLVVFSVVCGLFSFILCLTAEAARSEVIKITILSSWIIIQNHHHDLCNIAGIMDDHKQTKQRKIGYVHLQRERENCTLVRCCCVVAPCSCYVYRARKHAGRRHQHPTACYCPLDIITESTSVALIQSFHVTSLHFNHHYMVM